MNTAMWLHPLTAQQLRTVEQWLPDRGGRRVIIDPIEKILACGDQGYGAMADVADIARATKEALGSVDRPPAR